MFIRLVLPWSHCLLGWIHMGIHVNFSIPPPCEKDPRQAGVALVTALPRLLCFELKSKQRREGLATTLQNTFLLTDTIKCLPVGFSVVRVPVLLKSSSTFFRIVLMSTLQSIPFAIRACSSIFSTLVRTVSRRLVLWKFIATKAHLMYSSAAGQRFPPALTLFIRVSKHCPTV